MNNGQQAQSSSLLTLHHLFTIRRMDSYHRNWCDKHNMHIIVMLLNAFQLHLLCRVFRSCRQDRKLWNWTPVVSPHRVPLYSQATSGTINTSSRCPRWASDYWREVRNHSRTFSELRFLRLSLVWLASSAVVLSDPTSLHPCGPGLSHSALLCGRSICGYHDCRGSGDHVCFEEWLLHGEEPTRIAEATDPHSQSIIYKMQTLLRHIQSGVALICAFLQQSRVITLCAFRDVSGMFTTENKVNYLAREETPIRTQSETETIIQDIRWPITSVSDPCQ